MARVHHRKAAKDYPQFGIAKGDMHYYVKIKTGPRSSREMRSKTPFKRSQLTQSDYLSQLYDWEDSKAEIGEMDSAQQFADDIRALGEEQGEKFRLSDFQGWNLSRTHLLSNRSQRLAG